MEEIKIIFRLVLKFDLKNIPIFHDKNPLTNTHTTDISDCISQMSHSDPNSKEDTNKDMKTNVSNTQKRRKLYPPWHSKADKSNHSNIFSNPKYKTPKEKEEFMKKRLAEYTTISDYLYTFTWEDFQKFLSDENFDIEKCNNHKLKMEEIRKRELNIEKADKEFMKRMKEKEEELLHRKHHDDDDYESYYYDNEPYISDYSDREPNKLENGENEDYSSDEY